MRIALVHDYLREYGGGERVLETLHEMFPDAPVYTSYYFPEVMPEQFKKWDIRTSSMQRWWNIRKRFLWYTYAVPWVFEQFDFKEFDLLISSSSFAAKGILTNPGQIHIDYCHTPTRFIWGLNRTSNRKFIHSLLAPIDTFLRQWDFAAAQRVDYFIANSKVVQQRIKQFYMRDSEVIYPPVVDSTKLHVQESTEKFFLVVSRLERLKNVEVIIRAFNTLGLPLKVVGTGSQQEYLASIAGSTVEMLGYLDDEARNKLYASCRALVVATENEDFGMTIPEVQSFGRPVIALRSGGYVESVTEGKTGVFFDQPTETSIHDAVENFQKLSFNSEEILAHAQQFSKVAFIQRMKDFIEKVSLENQK